MVRAIGLSGFAQTGKTTAANYIEQNYGFERKHIAEPLRAMLATLLKINGVCDEMITRYLVGDLKDGVIIPELGCTSRWAQQALGTQWGRKLINPALWSDTWRRTAGTDKVMNDSVRFLNEEDAIRELGGFTILIERPGTGPNAYKGGRVGAWLGQRLYRWFGKTWLAHESERPDLLNPTYRILNDGTLEDLYRAIDGIMEANGIPLNRPGSKLRVV